MRVQRNAFSGCAAAGRPIPERAFVGAQGRAGITLMEVIVSLTIFLISMAAIGALISMATDRSVDARYQSIAIQLCQAKISEFASGALPLSSQADATFDFDANWTWIASVESMQSPPGLWNIEVRVQRKVGGQTIEAVLNQMVLDPSIRGTTEGMSATAPVKTKAAASGKKTGG